MLFHFARCHSSNSHILTAVLCVFPLIFWCSWWKSFKSLPAPSFSTITAIIEWENPRRGKSLSISTNHPHSSRSALPEAETILASRERNEIPFNIVSKLCNDVSFVVFFQHPPPTRPPATMLWRRLACCDPLGDDDDDQAHFQAWRRSFLAGFGPSSVRLHLIKWFLFSVSQEKKKRFLRSQQFPPA